MWRSPDYCCDCRGWLAPSCGLSGWGRRRVGVLPVHPSVRGASLVRIGIWELEAYPKTYEFDQKDGLTLEFQHSWMCGDILF